MTAVTRTRARRASPRAQVVDDGYYSTSETAAATNRHAQTACAQQFDCTNGTRTALLSWKGGGCATGNLMAVSVAENDARTAVAALKARLFPSRDAFFSRAGPVVVVIGPVGS